MPVHFKVCGITNVEDADVAVEAGASSIGLNLIPTSARVIGVEMAHRIVAHVKDRALAVLVVADLSIDRMQELLRLTGAGCLQLHGDESADTLRAVLPHAYKGVRIGSSADVARAMELPGEYLLTDAKVDGKLGGTGQTFDWSLVEPLARARKLTLAGGLHAQNVGQAIAQVKPFCVDVASGVEIKGDPRRKDPEKIAAFSRAVRCAG
jgi:phosphoribosylanthranilate isomerase